MLLAVEKRLSSIAGVMYFPQSLANIRSHHSQSLFSDLVLNPDGLTFLHLLFLRKFEAFGHRDVKKLEVVDLIAPETV